MIHNAIQCSGMSPGRTPEEEDADTVKRLQERNRKAFQHVREEMEKLKEQLKAAEQKVDENPRRDD